MILYKKKVRKSYFNKAVFHSYHQKEVYPNKVIFVWIDFFLVDLTSLDKQAFIYLKSVNFLLINSSIASSKSRSFRSANTASHQTDSPIL